MAVKKIVIVPDPVLTKKADKIKHIDNEVKKLATDLKDTLKSAKKPEGAGIAANQIGVPKRICIVRNYVYSPSEENRYTTEEFILINPEITYRSPDLEIDWEGCLSVPDVYGKVARNTKIKVEAQTMDGQKIKLVAKNLFARVIQHEIDHLDGILFTSKVIGKTITEKELDELYEQA